MRPDPSVIQDDDKYEGPVPETIPLNFYARQGNVETSDADASAIVYIVDDEGKLCTCTCMLQDIL